MIAQEVAHLIAYVFHAHANQPTKPSKAVRKWDGTTPYGIHPTWCAMTLLTETTLPEELRERGAAALLLHDILEDTTAGLPEGTSAEVAQLVQEMTFESSDQEMGLIWERSPEVRLLKLYDKVSNLLDGVWMSPEKRAKYEAYLLRLCDDVQPRYGNLNIIHIAWVIARR
ncbi:MAG: hypothetical protein HY340_02055 [Candidatus Kerfeldbacteria bacterium]|nr:hypothetical protein [Candidatus Kerfeldbacteria bacterium]